VSASTLKVSRAASERMAKVSGPASRSASVADRRQTGAPAGAFSATSASKTARLKRGACRFVDARSTCANRSFLPSLVLFFWLYSTFRTSNSSLQLPVTNENRFLLIFFSTLRRREPTKGSGSTRNRFRPGASPTPCGRRR